MSYLRAAFEEHLVARDLSARTIRLYVNTLLQAAEWCRANRRNLRTLTASATRRMGDELWPFAHSRRRQARLALKYYWEMTGRTDGPYRAIRMPKKPRGRNRALTAAQARDLVKTADGWHPQGTAVLIGLYMALRASEIAAVRWDRFDADLGWYTCLGKGDVTASIPVHRVLRELLEGHRSAALFLFPGGRGRAHVTGTTVGNWTAEVALAAGVGHVTCHQLRHTAITELNDRTGDLRAAQAFARHARPETTALYTRVDSGRLSAAVEAIDYLG